MHTINFSGIEGKIIQSSPHGNYLVVQLSDRITICGTYSNKFNWSESPEAESGFSSFITYIGLKSYGEYKKFEAWVSLNGGYFEGDDGTPRVAKRVKHFSFPLEIKVRGLIAESVVELVETCL